MTAEYNGRRKRNLEPPSTKLCAIHSKQKGGHEKKTSIISFFLPADFSQFLFPRESQMVWEEQEWNVLYIPVVPKKLGCLEPIDSNIPVYTVYKF